MGIPRGLFHYPALPGKIAIWEREHVSAAAVHKAKSFDKSLNAKLVEYKHI